MTYIRDDVDLDSRIHGFLEHFSRTVWVSVSFSSVFLYQLFIFQNWILIGHFKVCDSFDLLYDLYVGPSLTVSIHHSAASHLPTQTLLEHKNYLYRISAILSTRALAEVGGLTVSRA